MKRASKQSLKIFSGCLYDVLALGMLVTVASVLSQGRSTPKLLKGFGHYSVWRMKQALHEQKIAGFIEYDEDDEHSPIILTEKGFLRSAKNSLKNVLKPKWDHFWRLIVFDIPEKKKVRAKFQRLLKAIGCYQLQKSVYAYPHDCKKEILRIAAARHVASYVDVLTVPHLGKHEKKVRDFYFQRSSR